MSSVRNVTLELLRHGKAHNQLLSPLTQYLALSGNHSAVTLTVPLEHQQFLNRVRQLRYQSSAEERASWLREMADLMSTVLGGATPLVAELSGTCEQEYGLLNLELVLSASELALLPFELANAPEGMAGAGESLQLQPQMPLTITRRVRRVSNPRFVWPIKPRILFVGASPGGVGAIPLEAHLLALRTVIDPWVKYFDPADPIARQSRIGEHLVFLPDASLADIQAACRDGGFTHVHFLAHGVSIQESGGDRFGIALHDSNDRSRMDVVDGPRRDARNPARAHSPGLRVSRA